MMLETLPCPVCHAPLAPGDGRITVARTFGNCLRRCEPCGVGYSNAARHPVRIHARPEANVPAEVRDGLLEVLGRAVNLVNRSNKAVKFAFERSEDAVTWTVFRYLQMKGALTQVARVAGHSVATGTEPRLLLWGTEVPSRAAGPANLEVLLSAVSEHLGESHRRRTEPDVIVDLGASGVIVIEAKLTSKNDDLAHGSDRWDKYLDAGFRDAEAVRRTGLYELTRNWRVALELAAGRPFTLINLGPETLFQKGSLDDWERLLDAGREGRFVRVSWRDLLKDVPLEPWMRTFCVSRRLLAPSPMTDGT